MASRTTKGHWQREEGIRIEGRIVRVDNEWEFTLPDDIEVEESESFDNGNSMGGARIGGKILLIFKNSNGDHIAYLERHVNMFDQYASVEDCKYDNEVSEEDEGKKRVILHDSDDLFVDLKISSYVFVGVVINGRIRARDISPFNITTEHKWGCDPSVVAKDADVIQTILKTVRRIKPYTATRVKEPTLDKDYIVEKGELKKYIGRDVDLVFPKGITSVGDNVFSGSNVRSVVIPEGVKSIGDRAFENCFELEKVFLPESLREIGMYCFVDCHSLSELTIPSGVTYIGGSAFSECYHLPEQSIPKGMMGIDSFTFKNCKEFRRVFLPEGVTYIGFSAFAFCEDLTDIYIPATVDNIRDNFMGDTPFAGIPDLTIHTTRGSYTAQYAASHSINVMYDYDPDEVTSASAETYAAEEETDTATVERYEEEPTEVSEEERTDVAPIETGTASRTSETGTTPKVPESGTTPRTPKASATPRKEKMKPASRESSSVLPEYPQRYQPIEGEKQEPKPKKKTARNVIIALILLAVALVAIIVPIMAHKAKKAKEDAPYIELQAALNDGTFSPDWKSSEGYRVLSNYDQRSLQIVGDMLTVYHNENNIGAALDLIHLIFLCKIDIDGKYFYASNSFVDWIKSCAEEQGRFMMYDSKDRVYYYFINDYQIKWNPNMMMDQVLMFVDERDEWVIVTVNNGFYGISSSEKAKIE